MLALLDTGVLLALVRQTDKHHEACLALFKSHKGALLSSEAVLTEAMHFLRPRPDKVAFCLNLFESGTVRLVPASQSTLARCRFLMEKYASLPMDYADSTLVCMAESFNIREIWTLDSDFRVYRIHNRGSFLIRPD